MKQLYLECAAGISGDMFVAAMLDLGADEDKLRRALDSIPLNGFKINVSQVKKAGIDATDFDVILSGAEAGLDHDMEYLHGYSHRAHGEGGDVHGEDGAHGEGGDVHGEGGAHGEGGHVHDHHVHALAHVHHDADHSYVGEISGSGEDGSHSQGQTDKEHGDVGYTHAPGDERHTHFHEDDGHMHFHEDDGHTHDHMDDSHIHHHGGGHHAYHHRHRHLSEILGIIDQADASENAKELAGRIFGILADAEAKAHGIPRERVHFHEVGAVDSIVDVIAAAVCFDDLGFERVYIPRLSEGGGTVRCAHGILPVPVPAVANIIQDSGLSLNMMGIQGEFVTPTGAAIAAAIYTDRRLPAGFEIKQIGIGAGKREYEIPSMLRAMEIVADGDDIMDSDVVVRLETDIDDASGESLGYVMEHLFEEGAREVHFMPIQMKKNRPGTELVVICDPRDATRLEKVIFEDTSTIGIRRQKMERTVLNRQKKTIESPFGTIEYKSVTLPDGSERMYPEYDSVRRIAKKNNISYGRACQLAEKFRVINESLKDVMI